MIQQFHCHIDIAIRFQKFRVIPRRMKEIIRLLKKTISQARAFSLAKPTAPEGAQSSDIRYHPPPRLSPEKSGALDAAPFSNLGGIKASLLLAVRKEPGERSLSFRRHESSPVVEEDGDKLDLCAIRSSLCRNTTPQHQQRQSNLWYLVQRLYFLDPSTLV